MASLHLLASFFYSDDTSNIEYVLAISTSVAEHYAIPCPVIKQCFGERVVGML